MSAAGVLEAPPAPTSTPETSEPIVRAYRLDWTFANVEDDELPDGKTRDDLTRMEEVAFYAEKHVAQVWPHADKWLREVPGSDVTVQLVEIPWEIWRDEFLGTADEVKR